MATPLVIGVDSSTTACKAIAWDRTGRAVAEGRASYPLYHPEPTWQEQDAEDWWRSLCIAVRELLSQVHASQVEALCITHQRETFVPVDNQGQPIRQAILWNDGRSRAQLATLDDHFGADWLHQLTGKPPSLTQSLPKIVWLVQHEPDSILRAYKILDVHAFLVHRLTGGFRTSLASADPMGLVDMKALTWAGDVITELGLRLSQFSELVAPGQVIGHVTDGAATATGLPAGLPVIAGAGDGQCAGLGANVVGDSRAYLNMGTAVIGGAFSAHYLTHRAFRTLCAPISGAYFLETVLRGGVSTVG